MALHRVLAVPEIVALIFSHLGPVVTTKAFNLNPRLASWDSQTVLMERPTLDFPTDYKRTLAGAARVCKKFSSPALDVLWSAQSSLLPLLSTLSALEKTGDKYLLTRKIKPLRWKRFKLYARRIRHYFEERDDVLANSVFIQLSRLLKGEPIMPSLVTLVYPISSPITLFICRYLWNIHIALGSPKSDEVGTPALLQTLVEGAPLLKHFSSTDPTICYSSRPLAKLIYLASLQICAGQNCTTAGLQGILNIHHLRTLYLHLDPDMSLAPLDKAHPHSLQSLIIYGRHSHINTILHAFTGAPLQRLAIKDFTPVVVSFRRRGLDEKYGGEEKEWQARLTTISQWSDSLASLSLIDACPRVSPLPVSAFEPIYGLEKLKHFTIESYTLMDFSDDDVARMAQAWPDIEVVALNGFVTKFSTTFASLEALATHCLNLRRLTIPLNIKLPAQPRILTHHLAYLAIRTSCHTIEDPYCVARHLDALFPFVDTITSPALSPSRPYESGLCNSNLSSNNGILHGSDRGNDTWSVVERVVKVCQVARADRSVGS